MATIDGPKYTGPLTIDLSNVKDMLVDIPPGGLKGARKEKAGIEGVLAELVTAIPNHGDAANIPLKVYERVLARTANLGKLREHETALEKLLEIIRETRGKEENDREDDIGVMAKAAAGAAKQQKNPGIAAPFEKTIAYNAQIADKAAETRRKNEEAEAEAEAAAAKAPTAKDAPAKNDGQPPPA